MRTLLTAALFALGSFAASGEECPGRLFSGEAVLGGEVCLPEELRRVVVLDPFYNFVMGRELGLPIVGGATDGFLGSAATREGAEGIESIGQFTEPNLETITRLRPDLILGDAYLQKDNLALFSQIAPTALIAASDWKVYFRTIAALAGKETAAEERLAAFEARAGGIAARLPAVALSVVRILPGAFQVYVDGPNAYAPYRVLAEAGVKRLAYETATDDTILKRPDWEGLNELQGDVLFYIVGSGGDDGAFADLEAETLAHPLWAILPAVRNGRTYRVDADTWMGFGGIESAHRVLDDIERYLIDPPK